ncbi:transposase [Bradyrhizobium sp. USDA 3240]
MVRQRATPACATRAHFAEFGIIAGQGRQRADGLVGLLDDEELMLPAHARIALAVLVNQLKELDRQVEAIERELAQIQRINPMAKLLSSIPGIGHITATALAATVPDATMFRSGREFAAWLGLTPKQNFTGGKDRLGRITNRVIPISGTCLSSEHVTSFGAQRHAPGLEAAGSKSCLNGVGHGRRRHRQQVWPGSSGR